MNSTQGAAIEEDIFDDRGKRGKLLAASHNAGIERNGTRQIEGAGEQGSAVKLYKSLVHAHARAFASREDKGSHVGRRDRCHAEIIHFAPRAQAYGQPDLTGADWGLRQN